MRDSVFFKHPKINIKTFPSRNLFMRKKIRSTVIERNNTYLYESILFKKKNYCCEKYL